MQFNDQTPLAPVAIDSYTAGEIIINQTAYTHNVQLGDNVALFAHASPHDLTLADFQAALHAGAQIILIGTGEKQQFLSPKLAAALSAHGAALECRVPYLCAVGKRGAQGLGVAVGVAQPIEAA